MESNNGSVTRRQYLATTGVATAGLVGLAGCIGGSTGRLATRVTDQPGDIADFESCVVTIRGLWLGPDGSDAGDEEGEEPSDREYHEFDDPQTADLVDLQGENTQLIDERDLDVGEYEFLQLDTGDIDASLADGGAAMVDVPGDAPLTFNEPFEIRSDTQTVFTADFTPVKKGQTDSYVLQPVPDGITVEYQS